MKRLRPSPISAGVVIVLLALAGCDAVESARGRLTRTDTLTLAARGTGLMLGLQTPSMLRTGEEGIIRLTVANRSDTSATNIRVELVAPGWVEPLPPRQGDRAVTMAALAEGGTRFTYASDDAPLEPGQTFSVEQRIRVPAAGIGEAGSSPWTRTVRARLLGADGEALAEVEGEIALDGVQGGEAGAPGQAAAGRDQIGPVRLGMTAAAARSAGTGARDTTWSQEGMAQRGVVVPVSGGGRVLAVLDGDSVTRIEVRERSPRTREGLGVGSTLGELRGAWGPACAGAGEGIIAVWFQQAPGISFALDTPFGEDAAALTRDPARIPDGARVTRWWLRRGASGC